MRLSNSRLILFTLPALVIGGVGLPVASFFPKYYAEHVGLGLATTGTIFMLARIWDVVTDPMVGILSDRFPSPMGRRRHWMLIGMPIFAIGLLMMTFPPIGAGAVYLAAGIFVFYIGYSLTYVSLLAWGAEMSPDYHERGRIMAFIQAMFASGTLCVILYSAYLATSGAGIRDMVVGMSVLLVIAMPIVFFPAVLFTKEKPCLQTKSFVGFRESLRIVAANGPLQRLLAADFITGLAAGLIFTLTLFYAQNALKLPVLGSVLLLVAAAGGVVFMPLWAFLSKRFGKHIAFSYGCLSLSVLTVFIAFVPQGAAAPAVAAYMFQGVAISALLYFPKSIVADVIDYDVVKTGQERSGLFYALVTLTHKLGLAAATGLSFYILALVGFEPLAEDNPDSAINGLRALTGGGPAVFYLFIFLIMRRFPLDQETQIELRMQIEMLAGADKETKSAASILATNSKTEIEPGAQSAIPK
ncbi:MAG: MFS transporter [Pseudomonadota bacterium]